MAERREFDFFNYIFNRDGEEDQAPTETKEEQLPLMNHTEKSDEDDASNSTAAVIQPQQPQSISRQPRRAQPNQLQKAKIERREFDLFAYIFNRDGEEDEPPTEPQEEDVHLVDLTVDSDEDGASNSTAAVIQPQQPQSSSRLPRRAQPVKLQEAATDSEDEEEKEEEEEEDDDDDDKSSDDVDSSDEEASSSSKRRSLKTGARSRGKKSNFNRLEIMKFDQLEEKDKDGAQPVLDLLRDRRWVHICSLFMSGKCRYMSKYSSDLYRHMKSRHPNEKHPGYKITQYAAFKDNQIIEFKSKPYAELKQIDPQLAEEILALYTRPQNKKKQKVHLCGHFVRGECQYFSISTARVESHMVNNHSRTLSMIKIVGYPGERERTYYEYEQMTHAELKSKRSEVADEVLKCYYDHNCRHKVHLCGACDYFSKVARHVRDHVARYHPPTTCVYKIIEYPRLD